jgi:hypothetical protein
MNITTLMWDSPNATMWEKNRLSIGEYFDGFFGEQWISNGYQWIMIGQL